MHAKVHRPRLKAHNGRAQCRNGVTRSTVLNAQLTMVRKPINGMHCGQSYKERGPWHFFKHQEVGLLTKKRKRQTKANGLCPRPLSKLKVVHDHGGGHWQGFPPNYFWHKSTLVVIRRYPSLFVVIRHYTFLRKCKVKAHKTNIYWINVSKYENIAFTISFSGKPVRNFLINTTIWTKILK